jgi:transcriptional regulator with XRE-family HTH domain
MLDKNEFGNLVKAYRKQRGWTLEQLAERWERSPSYISQIENGQRKLTNTEQVVKLADILNIPQEKLDAIGRGIPERKKKANSSKEADEAILPMLLAPGRDMVRFAWIAWLADQHPVIEEKLRDLIFNLDKALTTYQGEFTNSAQQLLAYAHQMQGKIAFDRLDYAAAGGHFSEMIDLGHDLNDAEVIALGMTHQGDVFRKRGRYETALKCFEASGLYAEVSSPSIQGLRHIFMARVQYFMGDEQGFLRSIHPALEIAAHAKDSIESLAHQFSLDAVLQEHAVGYTMLWKPEKALSIYEEAEKLRSFRPLREQGSFTIDKARAYLHAGEIEIGVQLSLKGIELASEYRSKRHIARLDGTYNRLRATSFGKDKRLKTLRDALKEAQQKQAEW